MFTKRSRDPLGQQVKGVLLLHTGDGISTQAVELMTSLRCQILKSGGGRVVVKATRGNLQSIKTCWLANDSTNDLSLELNDCIKKIVIGGSL